MIVYSTLHFIFRHLYEGFYKFNWFLLCLLLFLANSPAVTKGLVTFEFEFINATVDTIEGQYLLVKQIPYPIKNRFNPMEMKIYIRDSYIRLYDIASTNMNNDQLEDSAQSLSLLVYLE